MLLEKAALGDKKQVYHIQGKWESFLKHLKTITELFKLSKESQAEFVCAI